MCGLRCGIVCLACVVVVACAKNTPEFALDFFDVGQGDAILIRWHRQCLWLDFGPYWVARKSSSPFIASRHVCQKSFYGVSHLDSDHVGGLFVLAQQRAIDALWVSQLGITPRASKYLRRMIATGIRPAFDVPTTLQDRVEVLWPSEGHVFGDNNERSMVLRVWDSRHRRFCVLLAGDISKEVEWDIVSRVPSRPCLILKVAHHGSATSTSDDFLAWAKPSVAVISNGWRNTYGHPHPDVLSRLDRREVFVFRTDWMGRIEMKVEGQRMIWTTVKGSVVMSLSGLKKSDSMLK